MCAKIKQVTPKRKLALEKYYENPTVCKKCHNIIHVKDTVTVYETRQKVFCDSSCSASFNNAGQIKNSRNPENYCICGKSKKKHCEMCKSCTTHFNRTEKTIEDALHKSSKYASVKYNSIRGLARWFMDISGTPKTCSLCKDSTFDAVVEVCHIKPLSSFDISTQLKVVNSLENLVYLCPSHHAMFDKGLINLKNN